MNSKTNSLADWPEDLSATVRVWPLQRTIAIGWIMMPWVITGLITVAVVAYLVAYPRFAHGRA